MHSAQRETLAKRLLGLADGADQTEVLIASEDSALTRFTHEVSNQNVATADVGVAVRAIVDRRTGVARSNQLDDESLRDVVERAIAMARLAPSDPLQPDLPAGGSTTAPPGAYDDATAHATAERRAAMCADIFASAEAADQWCAGYVASASSGYTIANTSGALASFDGTNAGLNVKMNAADSTGFAEAHGAAIGGVDAAAAGRRAAEKAGRAKHPKPVDPGAWTVILEPTAFGELFVYLSHHFSAQSYDEGSSFCSDGLDKQYFADTLTVHDDYAHPLNPGMPFDFEGQPTMRVPLVENGIVRNVVTDSYYARKLERPNTGHALPAPNSYGPQPRNLCVAPGTRSLEHLIAETKRGLLITRFWYIRTVDQKKAVVTGMTRDGTFLVEDGKVTHGVRNLRFNQSILEALRNCELSSEQKRTGQYHDSPVAPAVKIDKFHFTSGTEF
ncbi:MAG: TldD/PmbA family protein [Candidatus Eremiobacteraeota bacterium]|nr:TldD/PmbA family protein [Candidatus Eremiobacteraeota bacterium]